MQELVPTHRSALRRRSSRDPPAVRGRRSSTDRDGAEADAAAIAHAPATSGQALNFDGLQGLHVWPGARDDYLDELGFGVVFGRGQDLHSPQLLALSVRFRDAAGRRLLPRPPPPGITTQFGPECCACLPPIRASLTTHRRHTAASLTTQPLCEYKRTQR